MHAILIDDMAVQRDLWERYLGKIPGLTLQFFNSPTAAENQIKASLIEGNVDLVITDQNLGFPIENGTPTGIELIGKIDIFCTENELPLPFIVLVSAQDRRHLRTELDQKGFLEIPVLRKTELIELCELVREFTSTGNTPEG